MEDNNNKNIVSELSNFHLHTQIGIGLCALFLIFCFIITLSVKWFLMVPIALGSGYLFYTRKGQSTGLEEDVCTYGYWTIGGLFIMRDIYWSSKIMELVDSMSQFKNAFGNF